MGSFPKFLGINAVMAVVFAAGADVVYDFSKESPEGHPFLRDGAKDIIDRRIEAGALAGRTLKHPNYFQKVKIDRPLVEVQLFTVEMKAEPGAGKVQVFANIGESSAAYLEQPLICDGEFHIYYFDLAKMPKVKQAGILKNFRLGPTTAAANFAIRSIKLAPNSAAQEK